MPRAIRLTKAWHRVPLYTRFSAISHLFARWSFENNLSLCIVRNSIHCIVERLRLVLIGYTRDDVEGTIAVINLRLRHTLTAIIAKTGHQQAAFYKAREGLSFHLITPLFFHSWNYTIFHFIFPRTAQASRRQLSF